VSVNQVLWDRALRLLGAREHTSAELTRKLARHGCSEDIQEVIRELQNRGYVNDSESGYRRALALRTRKLYGNSRIAQDLQRLGLGATMIRLVLGRLECEAPESESLGKALRVRVARMRAPRNRADLKRLYDYAVRLGYPPGAVRNALRPFFVEAREWEDPD
jgi:SOS response regulatory protein OraA/RecX